MQYAPMVVIPNRTNERARTPLAPGGDFASSRIFDAVRVSQLPILMNCRQFKGIPQGKEGKKEGRSTRLPCYLSGNDAVAISSRFPSFFPSSPSNVCKPLRGAFLKDERRPSECHLNGGKTANCKVDGTKARRLLSSLPRSDPPLGTF